VKPNNAGCPELVKTCEDQLLFKPELQEFASSQRCLAEATIIAFGIEGVTQHFQYRNVFSTEQNELGVVVLRPSTKPFVPFLTCIPSINITSSRFLLSRHVIYEEVELRVTRMILPETYPVV
jgi:hypothetical protein